MQSDRLLIFFSHHRFFCNLRRCRLLLAVACLGLAQTAAAQQTAIHDQPDALFREAQEYFQLGKYAVAQQLFRKTLDDVDYFQKTNRELTWQDARYYYVICALQLGQPDGESLTKTFIEKTNNHARQQMASFQLARYYFHQNKVREAIPYYEKAGIDNLSNQEITDAKFELGYCYFNVKDFAKAQPLFASIKDIHNKYYIPSNYYYGFIAYYNKQYNAALTSFQRVVKEKKYDIIVPYYIAEIYYYQNKLDQLLDYALPYAQKGNLYYNAPLKHLIGQTYFEKKDYVKALPYLEEYEENTDELHKEDVYELAYCYYQTNELDKAISGFKQLSSSADSLGQNSMYLLGDCYLKTGQKSSARNAFAICARNSYNAKQQEISRFNYGKLSYELGYQDVALNELKSFVQQYPQSEYIPETREILAQLFMNTNDYKNALSAVEGIPNKTPNVRKAYQKVAYGRAMQLINDNQTEDAGKLLDISLQNPMDPQLQQLAYFWKGEISLRKGQFDQATAYLNQYFSLARSSAAAASGEANEQTAHYNLGYALMRKGDYNGALDQFKAAEIVFGANGEKIAQDAKLRTADCYYMLRNYGQAMNIYNQALSSGSGSDYALYQKSMILGASGKNDEKVSLLKQLAQQYPKSGFNNEADYEIGSTYITEQKYREAVPYLERVIQQQPNSPNAPKATLKLGLAHLNMGDNGQATDYYKKVVQQYPNSPESNEALQSLRTLYVNNGNTDAFLSFLKSTGKTITRSVADSVTFAAAEARFGNGDYSGALSAFNNYLSRYPQGQFTLNANFYKAECLFMQKDYSNALNAYEYILSQGNTPFTERAVAQAGRIEFYENKDYSKALQYYGQLKQIAVTRDNALEARRGLLRANYELQNWDQVKTSAADLLALSNISTDDQIVAHFYAGQAYRAQDNCDSALVAFGQTARQTKSELGAQARYYIAECHFKNRELKQAETAAFDVIKNTPSYDYWVASAYILLGDIYTREKDYFNAKATLQSIVDNSKIPDLVSKAKEKLSEVESLEKSQSRIKEDSTK
ncbi:tetratricopeptide repeat protein [Compostibacter hankyongensis]|uniref:Tetratricopeptide repeat protein n=1 Tax=Compostibacter hankyongensis TaxID=1007089 RepID=A0ABP8G2G8_9BACT